MTSVSENLTRARRGRSRQLFQSNARYNTLTDKVIGGDVHKSPVSDKRGWVSSSRLRIIMICCKMHRSTRTGIIGIAILAGVILVVLLLNLDQIIPSHQDECVKLEGGKTCHSTDSKPYRYYGTKTAYHVAVQGNSFNLDIGNCTPKAFYHLNRHATRYPDTEEIMQIAELLPSIRKRIINSSLSREAVEMCGKDIEILKSWTNVMKPESGNKLSSTGEKESEELARRLRKRFPSILDHKYSKERFVFEYTSRERTRTTAEFFAKGLFDDDYKNIDFDNKENDRVLQFHKICGKLQKRCNSTSNNMTEVDKLQKGLVNRAVESISKRIGFDLNYEEVEIMYVACVFGYALEMGDDWCSLFSTDELKVLEYLDDIDDYYKDAYGHKINVEQACPVAEYIVNLFRKSENNNDSKVVLHFSHAGALKKVISMFGLFKDEKPLTAKPFCSQRNRKWRASLIVPFNSNIELVLYQCGNDQKVATFHNERPVHIGGCDSMLCPLDQFYKTYAPVANNCDINKICCTCCEH